MIQLQTTAPLAYMLAAHCIGDGVFQNHWMQRKNKDSWICTCHILSYLIPFWLLMFYMGLHWWVIVLIGVQHWLQDRFSMHLWWMQAYRQTNASLWPTGPLYVDQCIHIGFIALFALFN